ncbi:TetR/AcrR family transcriptional regulator [Marinobacterium mangrovicola]|uniref:TetR family transcriptional regulator n=1 Tax=Marinobacterium mangrovicola TaxID=1476959 RepID=A0A4R1GIR2_9GAMM|nr:TetR/AcrR family transcriptional regulator [Marinobacterium mangrovicola]TCK07000.1 TetR family transcriptional regulator [Marinobacterium mangrovicola]
MTEQQKPDAPRRRGRRSSQDISGREALIHAAIRAFAQRGYEGASLRMIAREAQVDVALCARLFGNKEQLWQAVIAHLAEKFESDYAHRLAALESLSEQSPRQALEGFIRLYADICMATPAFTAFLLQESNAHSLRLEIIIEKLTRPLLLPAHGIVRKAQAAGVVAAREPELFVRMLTSALALPMTTPALLPAHTRSASNLEQRIVDEVLSIFLLPESGNPPV